MLSKNVVDICIVREISKNTGKVIEYEKPVFKENSIQKDIKKEEELRKFRLRQDEFNAIREEYFGTYYTNFFKKMNEVDIPYQMKTRFLYLCSFCDYDGYVVSEKATHKSKLNKKEVGELFRLGKQETYNTLNELINSGLLIEESNAYKVNNQYVVRGEIKQKKSLNGDYVRVFDNSIRELYEQCTPRQHKQLYYLYALLPYINLKYNVVTRDVSEQDYENIIPMSMKEVCLIVGYDETKSKRLERELLKLMINDRCVIGFFTTNKYISIEVNPAVYYGGTSNQVEALKMLMAKFGYSQAK